MSNHCYVGDCREIMRRLISDGVRVQCIVTSPPYFGLRDYGVDGQLGLEETPNQYIANMVEVFRLARELLADDGTLWLNIGDSYNSGASGGLGGSSLQGGQDNQRHSNRNDRKLISDLKPKDLIGVPWMLAFSLRADGWYLRQDIIWSKPNPMPESVRDRCTKSHEYIFMLSKSQRYYYDQDAIKEPMSMSSVARLTQPNLENQEGSARVPGKTNGNMKAVGKLDKEKCSGMRNKRSVWTVTTQPYKGAHFATFPPALIEPCILAGSSPNSIVFDPFMGSGTTAQVAQRLGRQWLGCELNPEYVGLQAARTRSKFDDLL